MKKNKIILIIIFLIAFILLILGVFAYYKQNNTKSSKKNNSLDQIYECEYIVTDNFELNTFKEKHSFDILVNENVIKNVKIYKNYYFNDKESFDRVYSMYNSDKSDGYKIEGYDSDSLMISITKTETPNTTLNNYLKKNNILEKYCSKKEKNAENKKEKQVNNQDKKYICKYNNLVSYITVDKNNMITSIMNGTTHKVETVEEFNTIKNTLKENDVLKYLYDEANLTITQLNKMFIYEDMEYDKYIKNSLSNYECIIDSNE